MSDDPAPSEAVAALPEPDTGDDDAQQAAETGEEGAEATGDTTDTGDGESGDTSLYDALTHTQPDMDVEQVADRLGVSKPAAHVYVGVRKTVAAFGTATQRGTMAIENFALALVERVRGGDEQDEQPGDDRAGRVEEPPAGGSP